MHPSILVTFFFSLFTIAASAVQCPDNFEEVGGKCFHFFHNIETSFLDGQTVCKRMGGDLAILDDCYTFSAVLKHIRDSEMLKSRNYWIGGTNVVTADEFLWLDGSPVASGSPFWGRVGNASDEPMLEESHYCVYLSRNDMFFMHDGNCDYVLPSLCQKKKRNSQCDPPYVELADSCFEFVAGLLLSWSDARTLCSTSGGDLAVLDDCAVFSAVSQYLQESPDLKNVTDGYWIGGSRNASSYYWLTNQEIEQGTPFWGQTGSYEVSSQPDNLNGQEGCMELWAGNGHRFNDANCREKVGKSVLCEVQAFTSSTERTTTGSNTTISSNATAN